MMPRKINLQNTWPGASRIRAEISLHPANLHATQTNWGMVADIAAWYQHLALPDPQRFVFQYKGRLWSPTAIPTGASYCPQLAHTIACAIAAVAIRRAQVDVAHEVYIDNFRFLGSFDDLTKLRPYLIATCTNLSVLLNDIDKIQPSTDYVFLGIRYAHTLSLSVGPKLERKLQEFRFGLSHNRQFTLREFLALFGACIWVTMAFGLPLYKYYYAFKFLRRKVDKNLDDRIQLWTVLPNILIAWLDDCLGTQPWPAPTLSEPPGGARVLVTDACLSGWGALLLCSDRVHVVADSWPPTVLARSWDINVLEMLAVRFAHKALLGNVASDQVHLVVDNTTVINTFDKQRSRGYLLNAIAGDLPRVWASISYVPSALNPADWLSRYSVTHGRGFAGTVVNRLFSHSTSVAVENTGGRKQLSSRQ